MLRRRWRGAGDGLPAAPEIEVRNLPHAGNGAHRSAALLGQVFAANIVHGVFGQRFGRKSALLRAVMHQAVFANIEVSRSGPAAPMAGTAVRDVVLIVIDLREVLLF